MNHPQFKYYNFTDPAHWQTGAYKNLALSDGAEGLVVLPGFNSQSISNTDTQDHTSAMDMGPCDRLYWLRGYSKELMCLHTQGMQSLGQLSQVDQAKKISIGLERLWVLAQSTLTSYSLQGLQLLRQLKFERQIIDIADNFNDGVWCLLGGDKQWAQLMCINRYGQSDIETIDLKIKITKAALQISTCGKFLVILDMEIEDTSKKSDVFKPESLNWRIIVVDHARKETQIFSLIDEASNLFNAELLCIDNDNHVHLVDPEQAIIWTVNLDGMLIAKRQINIPNQVLPITAITASGSIALSTRMGVFCLQEAETTVALQDEDKFSTFITPTLFSPEGAEQGWQRAQIQADLPEGTTLEVSYASSEDPSQVSAVNRIFNDATDSSSTKLNRLNQQLKWNADNSIVYVGKDTDEQILRLNYSLNKIDEPYLWLRFKFYVPEHNYAPALESLAVSYPNRSYLNYLPAVYQQDRESAINLKSLLTIFEVLFDDLDTTIDQLPRLIHPDTAPNNWLGFLLSWLGLPKTQRLNNHTQRRLLVKAPELLAQRGTLNGLHLMLETIMGERSNVNIEIVDIAAGPTPWVLQPADRKFAAAVLGCDTLILPNPSPLFRLGKAQLGDNETKLPDNAQPDPKLIFQGNGQLIIRLGIDDELREQLEPVIDKFLPYFIPAHCRYKLEFMTSTPQSWQRRLDIDLQLSNGQDSRLGTQTIAGQFQLPKTFTKEIILDRHARLDGTRLLN